MALLPYLLDLDLRPRRVRDQFLGLDLSPEDFVTDILDRPARKYIRPWRNLVSLERDMGSTISTDKHKFQVNLDVQHFAPEEVSVKVVDNCVVIEGEHEEKKDEHGFISRQFKRRYTLPEDCNPDAIESKLSSDGVLTITAPKKVSEKGERLVPITQTGPVRRKIQDGNDENVTSQNGEVKEVNSIADVETKSPQKKKRR